MDLLNGAFSPPKTIDQYRGELSSVFLKPQEHVLDYISRVKDLRTTILDADRRFKGQVDLHFLAEIDELTSRLFCDGLPLEYRLQMKTDKYRPYIEAFAVAKAITKRQELDKQRYESRAYTSREQRDMKPIGRLLAHSTPQKDNYFARQEPVTRSPVSPYRSPAPRNSEPRDPRSSSGDNNYRRDDATRRDNTGYANRDVCRCCKNPGHTIEECRKRQYNNSRRNESGNARNPSGRPDATRTDSSQNTRSVKPINVEEGAEPESQS